MLRAEVKEAIKVLASYLVLQRDLQKAKKRERRLMRHISSLGQMVLYRKDIRVWIAGRDSC